MNMKSPRGRPFVPENQKKKSVVIRVPIELADLVRKMIADRKGTNSKK